MRPVIFTDNRGYKRRYLVRDNDGDEVAAQGVPAGPPDMRELDLEAICKEINNALVEQNIFTWEDVNGHPVGLSLIASVIKRYVAGLLKDESARQKKLRS